MKTENQGAAVAAGVPAGAIGVPGAPVSVREPNTTFGGPPAATGRPPAADNGPSATTGAPNKSAGVRGAFIWSLRQMGLSTAFFAGILVLVVLFISIVLSFFGESFEISFNSFVELPWAVGVFSYFANYGAAFITAGPIFFLVVGIVMPTYLETLLTFGLTRQQYALGLLLAAALLIGGIGLVCTFAALAINQFTLPQDLSFFTLPLRNGLFFLTGWLIVIGYLCRSVIGAILTTSVGAVVFFSELLWPLYLLASPFAVNGTVNLGLFILTAENVGAARLVSALVLIAILIPTVIALTRRVPIKV
jgi:hypothetical protein